MTALTRLLGGVLTSAVECSSMIRRCRAASSRVPGDCCWVAPDPPEELEIEPLWAPLRLEISVHPGLRLRRHNSEADARRSEAIETLPEPLERSAPVSFPTPHRSTIPVGRDTDAPRVPGAPAIAGRGLFVLGLDPLRTVSAQ